VIPKDLKLPFYAKASLCCIGLYAFVSVLYIAQAIIVPFIFSIIFAVVLHPVVNFMVRKGINRVVAISLALTLSILIIAALGAFLVSQLSTLADSWPKLVDRFTEIFNQNIRWASGYFDISPQKIKAWITLTKGELINNNSEAIGQTLLSVGNALVLLILIPVYIFMILFYQPLLLEFFRKLFGTDNRAEVSAVISQIKTVNQQYLTGLIIEAILVSALNAAGLLILGIDYAVLLGIIGGLLNVIPYLGGIVAVALPMMIALVTKTSAWYAVYVMGVYYFIQLIDNNYIVPKIVASKVKINALVSIIVVLIGGALWGFSGMFLSIPLTAIIKVICDHIEPLKPWGFLLGDTMPVIDIFKIKLKRT
jgi:predicted PurR-regulated permease PerM